MAEVIELDNRRQPYEGFTCANCGGSWFFLMPTDRIAPVVVLSQQMNIVGYTGKLICTDCAWEAN